MYCLRSYSELKLPDMFVQFTACKETLGFLQEHDEDDGDWEDADDDDDDDDDMNDSDSLPGLLSQLAGDGKLH